jgi:hypothetical protein
MKPPPFPTGDSGPHRSRQLTNPASIVELWRCHKDKKAGEFANKFIFVTKMRRYLPLHLLLCLRPFLAIIRTICCQLTESSPEEVNAEITGIIFIASNELNREMKHFVVATLGGGLQFNTAVVANLKF